MAKRTHYSVQASQSRWRATVVYLAAAVAASAIGWTAIHTHQRASREALADFRAESAACTDLQARNVSTTLNRMYEGLRTIARLPGVRNIDRYAKNFSDDARLTVQEIYNNLGSNVAMSEVYIVPLDLQPDKIDPVTGKPQAPITTFDHTIIGRTADSDEHGSHDEAKVEEIEIHEYRLMRRQLDFLASRFADESSIKGLEYPAVIGPQVVTCDNSRFHVDHPNDQDRSGLVYSVPFYAPDGKLKGCVSGVILSASLGDLLETGDYAISSPDYGFFVANSKQPGTAAASPRSRNATIDPTLPFCESRVLPIVDMMGEWRLWVGRSPRQLAATDAMRGAQEGLRAGLVLALVVAAALTVIGWLVARGLERARARATELEATVRARTRLLNTALQEADAASRAKSEFLANMSHEIRTPMTAIVGYSNLLLDHTQTPSDRMECVQTICRNGEHLLSIINDILDISKIEAGKMTVERVPVSPVQLAHEVRSLLDMRAGEKQLELKVVQDWPLPEQILGDPVRLRQVLVNLVGNAIKFTRSGSVTVRVAFDQAASMLHLQVRDTGIGMTKEQLANLFQPFSQGDTTTTRKFGGTGLGLSISRQLAEKMGGTLLVDSTPGQGSTFTFQLPTGPVDHSRLLHSPPPSAATEVAAPGPARVMIPYRILLAEDGPDNQRLIAFHLRRAGATVEIAENGRIAVERTLAAQLTLTPFDLILMDMQMPELDGYGATSELRAKGLTIPILALTAHAMAEDRLKCLSAGCSDFLTKPIDPKTLVLNCQRWLQQEGQPGRPSDATPPSAKAA
ncbi:MAG: ATP-binding protein [Planctomycetota bacterium]